MDLASVSSIGGGAVAFFPPLHHYQHIPPRGRGSDAQLTAQELLSQCESTARKLRARGSDIYGAIEGGDSRRGALFCRSGTWLEILDEYTASLHTPRGDRVETIRGSTSRHSRYGLLDFVSVAIGLVSIRGVEANRYLCMNREGRLYSTPFSNFSAECVFLEEMMENYYNVYSSCAHGGRKRPWYVALRRTGRPRDAKRTRKRRKASHFLVVHYDDDAYSLNQKDVSLAELLIPSLKHQPPNNLAFRQPDPPKRPPPRRTELPPTAPSELQRRNKKKRRRQQRLQTEEAVRRRRKEEIDALRTRELEAKDNRIAPRLSGAGLQYRPRRTHHPN